MAGMTRSLQIRYRQASPPVAPSLQVVKGVESAPPAVLVAGNANQLVERAMTRCSKQWPEKLELRSGLILPSHSKDAFPGCHLCGEQFLMSLLRPQVSPECVSNNVSQQDIRYYPLE